MNDAAEVIQLIGRILFAIPFAMSGVGFHIAKGSMAVGYARQMRFPFPFLASWVAGLWLVAGSLSIALGIWPDIGSLMIAAFVIPAAAWFHRFWELEDQNEQMVQSLFFWRNAAYLGGSLVLFVFFATFGHDLAYTITGPVFDLRLSVVVRIVG